MMTTPDTTYATILVVDDMPENIGVLFDFLTQNNFRVLVARDGADALRTAEKDPPDLILLDVMMPGMDGFETCARLKNKPSTLDIPIIFMTALTETENKVRAFATGGVDYITKPFQQEEVLARVLTQLQLRAAMRDLQQQTLQKEELNRILLEHPRQLEQHQVEFQTIAGIVQRELKQPLLNMRVEIQAPDWANPEQARRRLENIAATRAQVLSVVEEVLLLAELRGETMDTEDVDMTEVANTALGHFTYLLNRTHTTIQWPDTWPRVLGRKPWIGRVWQTLLAYSLQHPGPAPRITLGGEAMPSGYGRFWLADNGPPMTDADQAALYRDILPEESGSHELSFFIARKIIDKYNGEFSVESGPSGNHFYFTLPLAG